MREKRHCSKKLGGWNLSWTGLKKKLTASPELLRACVDTSHRDLSIARQCELLGLARSSFYYTPVVETHFNLLVMRCIDEQYLKTPFYGSRKMAEMLAVKGHAVNRKRVQRLMRIMGLEAVYARPKTTIVNPEHKVYPYLLRGVCASEPNHIWSTDITYIPMAQGFLYLVAVIDWYSRFVLSWRLSNSLDGSFCREALDAALSIATPKIFNTDQGCQFTSPRFTSRLLAKGVAVSMDGKGRALDNIFVERLWRSLKYEDIYLKDYQTGSEVLTGVSNYFHFFNYDRIHQSLDYATPDAIYSGRVLLS